MCVRKLSALILCCLFATGVSLHHLNGTSGQASAQSFISHTLEQSESSGAVVPATVESKAVPSASARYTIDAAASRTIRVRGKLRFTFDIVAHQD